MAGFLSFLGFGKKEKPNLTQNYQAPPSASSAPLYTPLRDLASQRIKAGTTGEETPGVGFGPDFLSRTTNPAIAQIDANFQNRTLPELSSQASKRGIARSSIATDQIGQADLQRNRDIASMVAEMYKLNEMQKKTDITEGIRVGDQLNTQYLNQGNEQASQFNTAERGNTERTAARAATNNATSAARQNNVLQSIGGLLSPVLGDVYSKAFPTSQSVQAAQKTGSQVFGSPKANILGDMSSSQLGGMSIEDLLALLGG